MDYETTHMQLTIECNRLTGISEHLLAFGRFDANDQAQLDEAWS